MIKIKPPHGGVLRILEKGEKKPESHRKLVAALAPVEKYTELELKETILKMLTFQKHELYKVLDSKACTMFEKIIARVIVRSSSEANITILDKLLTLGLGFQVGSQKNLKIEQTIMDNRPVQITTTDPLEAAKIYQELMIKE